MPRGEKESKGKRRGVPPRRRRRWGGGPPEGWWRGRRRGFVSYPCTALRAVPLPIRCADREEDQCRIEAPASSGEEASSEGGSAASSSASVHRSEERRVGKECR